MNPSMMNLINMTSSYQSKERRHFRRDVLAHFSISTDNSPTWCLQRVSHDITEITFGSWCPRYEDIIPLVPHTANGSPVSIVFMAAKELMHAVERHRCHHPKGNSTQLETDPWDLSRVSNGQDVRVNQLWIAHRARQECQHRYSLWSNASTSRYS